MNTTAWISAGVVRSLQHKDHTLHGAQFHPEPILTRDEMRILENFPGF